MFWRPKPPHAGLPPVDTSSITWPTAVGKVKLEGISLGDCYKITETAEGVDKVKKALVEALGSDKLDVLLIMCSSLEADFVGPVEDVKKAEEAATKDDFCFKVDDLEICKPPLPTTTTTTAAATTTVAATTPAMTTPAAFLQTSS